MIPRILESKIRSRLFQGEIIILYGPRQVGKTTLVKKILADYETDGAYFNCEHPSVQSAFLVAEPSRIVSFFGNKRLIVLDEAQSIENIGLKLKVVFDEYPDIQIIATGSSSFELANKIKEPLTWRHRTFFLPPLSVQEITEYKGKIWLKANLSNLLRYGSYPWVFGKDDTSARIKIDDIAADYLYKDALKFEGIKKSSLLRDLLTLLAFQIGNEVSYSELATKLGVNRITVQKYVDLLEQAFVIFRLPAFARNLRNEVSKSVKIYFLDAGVRNSLIQNYNLENLRNDMGGLWENFCISERMKKLSADDVRPNRYFWRTYDQKEIDYIEEQEGTLHAYEIKYANSKAKIPKAFLEAYPKSEASVITKDDFEGFLGG